MKYYRSIFLTSISVVFILKRQTFGKVIGKNNLVINCKKSLRLLELRVKLMIKSEETILK